MRELKKNGSPLPEFETDADRTYMITTIKIHEGFEFEKVLPIIKYLDKNGKITPQVAEMVIKKSKSIYRWFKGSILPSVEHLCALSRLLDVHMEDLLVLQGQSMGDNIVEVTDDVRIRRLLLYMKCLHEAA